MLRGGRVLLMSSIHMTLNIKHRGIELTEAIKTYAAEKMRDLDKNDELIQHLDLEVGKGTNHHRNGDVFSCRALLQMRAGDTLRIDREAKDLYKAIDKVRDLLKEALGERHRAQKPVVANVDAALLPAE